jgi:hypothetical protein
MNYSNKTRKILIKEIDRFTDMVGYDGYIPYNLIIDMYTIYKDRITGKSILINNEYTESILDLISTINVGKDNILKAMVVLVKSVSKEINLRRADCSGLFGNKLEIESTKQQNYDIDVTDIHEFDIGVLGLPLSMDNTTEIPEEALEILHFSEQLTKLFGSFDEYLSVESYIRRFNELSKVRKYKLSLDDFKAKLALKKLSVRTEEISNVSKSDMVIMLDVSSSSAFNKHYRSLLKSVLISIGREFIDGFNKLTILEYSSSIIGTHTILKKSELIDYINELRFSLSSIDTKPIHNSIRQYKGSKILFVTDGNVTVNDKFPLFVKWDVILSNSNTEFINLCKKTGGKCVTIK